MVAVYIAVGVVFILFGLLSVSEVAQQ